MSFKKFCIKKVNFIKSNLGKTIFVLAGVVILFSFFPSCGQNKSKSKHVLKPHPVRDGHMTTAPTGEDGDFDHSQYIQDVSLRFDSTKNPAEITVGLRFIRDGQSGEGEEVFLVGELGSGGSSTTAKTVHDEIAYETLGAEVHCMTADCGGIVPITIHYFDKDGIKRTFQRASSTGNMTLDAGDGSTAAIGGTSPGRVIIGEIADRYANPEFVRFWQNYLGHLKTQNKSIDPELPEGLINTTLSGDGGNFITLNSDVETNTFARPINMRSSYDVSVDGQDRTIAGILLNGEPLINYDFYCVKWADVDRIDEYRYASSLLNATLQYVGNTLRTPEEKCAFDIYLGQASKQAGGEAEDHTYSYTTGASTTIDGNALDLDARITRIGHQNGLDVDIAYLAAGQINAGKFVDIVNDDGSIAQSHNNSMWVWQLQLLKRFYDTGMVNRFVMAKEVKARLVRAASSAEAYRNTLEKIYPVPSGHEDHFTLELVCGAGSVRENKWCRETSAINELWPIENCDDNTCWIGKKPDMLASGASSKSFPNIAACTQMQFNAIHSKPSDLNISCVHAADANQAWRETLQPSTKLCRNLALVCAVPEFQNDSRSFAECTEVQKRLSQQINYECKSLTEDLREFVNSSTNHEVLCKYDGRVCKLPKELRQPL